MRLGIIYLKKVLQEDMRMKSYNLNDMNGISADNGLHFAIQNQNGVTSDETSTYGITDMNGISRHDEIGFFLNSMNGFSGACFTLSA